MMKRLYDLIQERHSNEFLGELFPGNKSPQLKTHRDSGVMNLRSQADFITDEAHANPSLEIAKLTEDAKKLNSQAESSPEPPPTEIKHHREDLDSLKWNGKRKTREHKLNLESENDGALTIASQSVSMNKNVSFSDSGSRSLFVDQKLVDRGAVQRELKAFPVEEAQPNSVGDTLNSFVERGERLQLTLEPGTPPFIKSQGNSSSAGFHSDLLQLREEANSVFSNSKSSSVGSEQQRQVFRSTESSSDRASVARIEWSQRRF